MFRWPLTTPKEVAFDLRLLALRDADKVFALADANREHLRPWLPWISWTYSPDDVRNFVRTALKQFSDGDGFHAGVWIENQFAGCIGLHPIDWPNRSVALGYWIGSQWEGHGLITAGVRAVTRYCFQDLALERVEIRAGTGNKRSRAVPERLGFTYEGTLRRAQIVDGKWLDSAVYSMLREESGVLFQ